ncbi:protein ZAR1-like [Sphaeramia orbicularis]|uniref:protein ZAR1-like n=1 Tax=Sphaeramia orbicularis TaxID=375764 RepID=UPI00117DA619|nr:ZAR1-like protein [Sphaeramia orbicularis]
MEGFLSTFPPYNLCGVPACPPAPGSSWVKKEGPLMTPQGLNYLELCKAILSQVNPTLPPPLKKANTKECGVQVNAKVDKIIQCSLGPKTLFYQEGDNSVAPDSPKTPDLVKPEQLRFMRPVSIYSPVFDRRILMRKLSSDGESGGNDGAAEPAGCEDADQTAEDKLKDFKTTFQQSSKGSSLQFLEQRYGFFHCKKCNIRWESAYVWCISGTSKVYYKQLCRKCQVGFNPYRVESILCKSCSQTCCSCDKKQRHINMKRPHRQDLCCRCKGMRLSCDATYSFKYII